MNMTPSPRPVRRAAADAVLGLTLFVAFAFGLMGAPNLSDLTHSTQATAAEMAKVAAFTGPLATESQFEKAAIRPAILVTVKPDIAAATVNQPAAFSLLAAVFAALFAFNLAFFRHLRRVYAVPARPRRVVQR
jgi:hypothetical protein